MDQTDQSAGATAAYCRQKRLRAADTREIGFAATAFSTESDVKTNTLRSYKYKWARAHTHAYSVLNDGEPSELCTRVHVRTCVVVNAIGGGGGRRGFPRVKTRISATARQTCGERKCTKNCIWYNIFIHKHLVIIIIFVVSIVYPKSHRSNDIGVYEVFNFSCLFPHHEK